jgi:hypothetical protein
MSFLLKTTQVMISLRGSFGHRQVSLYGNGHSKKHKRMIPSWREL